MRFLVLVVFLSACGAPPRALGPWPPAGDPVALEEPRESPSTGPHVVRRLLAEAHALVESDQALARELPDPRGRARAKEEADTLARDLAEAEAGYPTEDSAALDELVDRMHRVTTRATLLHETLRTATDRITALSAQ